MESDKARILEKIKKCLALGKSSNANEAAAALRQAQKLMAKHGITEEELEILGYGQEDVDMPVQANKTLPLYISYFLDLIMHAFGVRAIVGRTVRQSDASYTISYLGARGRVMMAAYAHTVCWRSMTTSWTAFLAENPWLRGQRGSRTGFYLGWIEEVKSKVEEIGFTDEDQRRTDIMLEKAGRKLVKTKTVGMRVGISAERAGTEAGKSFSIHRPMNAERKRIGN